MSPVEWYYARDNKQQGPVSAMELKQLAQTGQLRAEDLVWREGMADWLPAGKVKGLFEEDAARTEARTPAASAAGSTFESSAAAFARSREAPVRHFFDHFLESVRLQFNAQFVESTTKVFSVVGHHGLYAAMLLLFTFHVILAARTTNLYLIVLALAWALALVVIQYVADRFLGALEKLNGATAGRMCSTAFLDCWAVLHILVGLILLIGFTLFGLHMELYLLTLPAIGLFVLYQFAAVLAINPETLRIEIVAETGAGEEAIGILSFLLKIPLRLAPVAFGVGTILGALWMFFACWLALTPAAPPESTAAEPLKTAIGAVPLEYGAAVKLATGGTALVVCAGALPLVTYLAFLLCHLGIDLLRAVLSVPGKLDGLRASQTPDKEKETG